MSLTATETFALLRADPHPWGPGRTHLIDEPKEQTWCGKGIDIGKRIWGPKSQMNCKACLKAQESRARAEENRREWEARQREREKENQIWWQRYDTYLQSPAWRDKRRRVLHRAGNLCEGCGVQRAVQVHHRVYPQDCPPGSELWIAREMLFDLVAICTDCHQALHDE
jgi:5-methylcytosine-specific restriction endonuclease McrA